MSFKSLSSKADYLMWTGKLAYAPFEVLEGAIRHCLGDIPYPMIEVSRYKYHVWYMHTPYDEAYKRLYDLYTKEIRPSVEECPKIMTFPSWEPDHPLLLDMEHNDTMFHYHWMESIVSKVTNDIKLTEIRQGWKYSDVDRDTLIQEDSFQIRVAERRDAESRARSHRLPSIPTRQSVTNPTTIDLVRNFDQSHPFLSGFLATASFYKIKDTLLK